MNNLGVDFTKFPMYNGLTLEQGETEMTNNKLVELIMNLTEEEVDKIISELPRLLAMLDKEVQPCPPEQTSQDR